ncbi:alpha/beta fold hydrolase [Catenovulum sediminis]|uniref:Alpha/beta hydrolase n=1 Tax=Catenovulum sediminis TaxID=1740262 RepID=A0ABV1RFC7_9ALTE
MKVLLIPGMDGTGELFGPLLAELPSDVVSQVICLNDLITQTPIEQAVEIAALLGSEEVIILSESYSGYIAYHLSLLPNLNIKHVIFAASFLENPTWLSHFSKLLPLDFVRSGLIPDIVLSFVLFAQCNDKKLVKLFKASLKSIDNSKLRHRLSVIANLVRPSESMSVPCTYVQANSDYLVSKKSVDVFKELCININVVRANGGHFIVQSNPDYFSKLIKRVIAK